MRGRRARSDTLRRSSGCARCVPLRPRCFAVGLFRAFGGSCGRYEKLISCCEHQGTYRPSNTCTFRTTLGPSPAAWRLASQDRPARHDALRASPASSSYVDDHSLRRAVSSSPCADARDDPIRSAAPRPLVDFKNDRRLGREERGIWIMAGVLDALSAHTSCGRL
jgi:hypothetical protein